jgi:vacuolar protein sorting-associated protein VTA1
VVNQILAKQLHNADDDCLNYTTALMDKLERVRRTRTFHKVSEL